MKPQVSQKDIQKLIKQALNNKVSKIDMENHGYVLIKDDQTFFCSELVAKAWKTVGIMKKESKASSRFYPKDFASASS